MTVAVLFRVPKLTGVTVILGPSGSMFQTLRWNWKSNKGHVIQSKIYLNRILTSRKKDRVLTLIEAKASGMERTTSTCAPLFGWRSEKRNVTCLYVCAVGMSSLFPIIHVCVANKRWKLFEKGWRRVHSSCGLIIDVGGAQDTCFALVWVRMGELIAFLPFSIDPCHVVKKETS